MKLKTVPAGQGLQWAQEGFRTLARRPMSFAALACAVVFAALVLPRVSVVLTLLFAAAAPLFTMGFMNAARQRATPRSTLAAFVDGMKLPAAARRSMLALCVAYTVCAFLAGLVVTAAYGDSLSALGGAMPGTGTTAPGAGHPGPSGRLVTGVLVQMVVGALLAVPFWHAPALIVWGGQRAPQAVFSSTVAVWRNRGAFTVYACVFFGLAMLLVMIGAPLLGALGGGPVVTMIVFSLLLLIPSGFYASLYWTFIGCFDIIEPSSETPASAAP